MLDILVITTPIYLIIGLGFVAVRSRYIPQTTIQPLTLFLMRISLPVLIFRTVAAAGSGTVVDPQLMLAFALSSLPLILLGRVVLHRFAGVGAAPSWSLSLGMANPNTVMIGLPLLMILFPDQAATVFTSVMLVENIVFIPLTLVMADLASNRESGLAANLKSIAKAISRNRLLLAILAGVLVRSLGLSMPAPLDRTLSIVAQIAPGLALFLVGSTVAQYSLRGSVPVIGAISTSKLILHPLVASVVMPWLVEDPVIMTSGIILASIPMLSIYPIFAQKTNSQGVAATALIVATGLSFLTVSTVLWLLRV